MSKFTRLLQASVVAGVQFLHAAHATDAAPKVNATVELLEADRIDCLLTAAETSGGKQAGQLSLRLSVVNPEAKQVRLNKVTATFAGPPNFATVNFNADVLTKAGNTAGWNHENDKNSILPSPAPKTIMLHLFFGGFTHPAAIIKFLAPHRSLVTGGAYLFPAKASDLRFNEF